MLTIQEMRREYEKIKTKKESEILVFNGVDGYDVYNCSIPFTYEGETYIFGRVEKRDKHACSFSYLFKKNEKGEWDKENRFNALQLEDPFVSFINGEIVLGGTHVVKTAGKVKTYYAYFYRGKDLFNLNYFTTGPDYMKDIRLCQLPEGKIGVFSRPRSEKTKETFGSEAQVGFTIINDLNELTADVIENAEYIKGLFYYEEWGGFNQVFYLGNNLIGAIGHQSYAEIRKDVDYSVYVNTAYLFDYKEKKILDRKVLATRSDYPDGPYKLKGLSDCVFTSGVDGIENDFVNLYSGLSDAREGVIKILNPFKKAKDGIISVL